MTAAGVAVPPDDPNPEKEFHKHLEDCEQCRNHPFDLCLTGLPLLVAIVPQWADKLDQWERRDSREPEGTLDDFLRAGVLPLFDDASGSVEIPIEPRRPARSDEKP